MKTAAVVVAFAAASALVAAECPNGCSGHGTCGANDACNCFVNWVGADCSERVCPFGLSFVDTPRGDLNHDGSVSSTLVGSGISLETPSDRQTNMLTSPSGLAPVQWSNKLEYEYFGFQTPATADNGVLYTTGSNAGPKPYTAAQSEEGHYYNECSGKGLCDRSAGTCKCFDGYTGGACERTTCPNSCSGHGVCLTVREIALGDRLSGPTTDLAGAITNTPYGRNYRNVDFYNGYTEHTGVSSSFYYKLWDAEKNQACACDAGYFGPDCSLRECPRGNDPLTNDMFHCGNEACTAETQYFYITHNSANAELKLRLMYNDKYSGGVTYYSDFFVIDTDTTRTARDYQNTLQAAINTFPQNVLGGVQVSINAVYSSGASLASHLHASATLSASSDTIEFALDFTNGPQGDVNAIMIDTATIETHDKGQGTPAYQVLYTTADAAGTTQVTSDYPTITCSASQAMGAGNCDPVGAGVFSYASAATGNTEYSPCSNRGLCDHTLGQCQCFTGYSGTACNVQAALAQ